MIESCGIRLDDPADQPDPPKPPPVQYAHLGRRLVAFVIDFVIVTLAQQGLMVAMYIAAGAARPGVKISQELQGAAFALSLGVSVFYWIGCESSPYHATPGKLLLGLRVTRADGAGMNGTTAAVRLLGRGLSYVTLGLGFLACFFGERRQCLHDRIAGSIVVSKSSPEPVLGDFP